MVPHLLNRPERLTALLLCFVVIGSAPSMYSAHAQVRETIKDQGRFSLKQIEGTLDNAFSVTFTADSEALSRVVALASSDVAITSRGEAIRISLSQAAPFPTKVVSVELISSWQPVGLIDPLGRPIQLPVRSGYKLVQSFREPMGKGFVLGWRDKRSEVYEITLWNDQRPTDRQVVLARCHCSVLGFAAQPTMHGIPDLSLAVWTRGAASNQAIVGIYGWSRSKRSPNIR